MENTETFPENTGNSPNNGKITDIQEIQHTVYQLHSRPTSSQAGLPIKSQYNAASQERLPQTALLEQKANCKAYSSLFNG